MEKERRAEDQEVAIVKAFEAGTLPEEDRRAMEKLIEHEEARELSAAQIEEAILNPAAGEAAPVVVFPIK